jgi:hypothetical protein
LATSFVPHFLLAEKEATVIINQQREAIEKIGKMNMLARELVMQPTSHSCKLS